MQEATNHTSPPETSACGSDKPVRREVLLQWAQHYRDRHGLIPIILDPNSKGVTREGWQREKGTDQELQAHYNPNSNLGILIGNPSNRLVDIDLDDPAAVRLASLFLPPTQWKSGHAVSKDSHWYYKLKLGSAEPKTHRFKYKAAPGRPPVCVLEYRWDGVQTVVYPSVHPDHGVYYKWSTKDGTPPTAPLPEVEGAALYRCCQYLFMACMLDEIWLDGQRHEVQMIASTALLQAGVAKDDIVEFFTLLGGLPEKREYTVQHTLEKIQKAEAIKSAGSLVKEFGLPQGKLDAFLRTLGTGQAKFPVGMSQADAHALLKQIQAEIEVDSSAALEKWAPRAAELSEAAATDEGAWLAVTLALNGRTTKGEREPFVRLVNKKVKKVQKAREVQTAMLAEQAEWASSAAKALEAPELAQSEIERLNRRYGFILMGGKSAVLDEAPEKQADGLGEMELIDTRSFREYYANVSVPDEAHPGEMRPLGSYWLTHPDRRTYAGFMFEVNPTPEERARRYNLFRGYKRTASRKGSCKLWLRHLYDVVCQRDKRLFRWVLAWMAYLVQNPDRMHGVALVLKGVQGCGKGVVIRALMEMFNANTLHVSDPRHIVGNFNKHLLGCCLLYSDEAYWAGDVKHEGALKRLITEPTLAIEVKGRDVFAAPNRISVAMTSNNDWVVPATVDGRRYTVVQVADTYAPEVIGAAASEMYFRPIYDELADGGYERLFQFFLDLKRNKLPSPHRHISTRALKEQVLEGLDRVSQWWFNCLMRGYVIEGDAGQPGTPTWNTLLNKGDVIKQYGVEGSRSYRSVTAVLGKKLRQLCPSMGTPPGRVGREQWSFPSLSDARSEFERFLKARIDWNWGEIVLENPATHETQIGASSASSDSPSSPRGSASSVPPPSPYPHEDFASSRLETLSLLAQPARISPFAPPPEDIPF